MPIREFWETSRIEILVSVDNYDGIVKVKNIEENWRLDKDVMLPKS